MRQKSWFFTAFVFLGSILVAGQFSSSHAAEETSEQPPNEAWLGVSASNVPFERLESFKLQYGTEITKISADSPAQKAGLLTGDIIVELNQNPVYSANRLQYLVSKLSVGDKVKLKYMREGKLHTVDVRLEQQSQTQPPSFRLPELWRSGTPASYLGTTLQNMPEDLREHFGTPSDTGVLIANVDKDSPASQANLQAGDVIIKMESKVIRSIDDVNRVLDFFDPGTTISIEIIRDGKQKKVVATLAEQPDQSNRPPAIFDPEYWEEELNKLREKWERFRQDTEARQHHGNSGLL